MAYFAELDSDNRVLTVVTAGDDMLMQQIVLQKHVL